MEQTKIEYFWNWFQKILPKLNAGDLKDDLIDEIDNKVLNLGPFSWEIGPGLIQENSFVISPNGNIELLEQTRKIIDLAPKVAGWEFHCSKPPKNWNFNFSFLDDNNKEINVNANDWEYVLSRYPDKTFDIYIKGPYNSINEANISTAIEILIIGILGEEEYINKIRYIEAVKEFEQEFAGKQSKIKYLKTHIDKLHQ
jgi:hypothetical protein